MFLKERRFEGKYASFKNIEFPKGNYHTDSSKTDINTLLSLLLTTKFSSARQIKNQIKSQTQHLKKKTNKNPLNTIIAIVSFS